MAWSPLDVLRTAAALMCTFTLFLNYVRADCGGFALSCDGITVSPAGGLQCICKNGRGGYQRASLDLNAHISNNNGNLVDGGNFAASCKNIRWYHILADQGIAAECYKRDGSLGSTTLYNVQRRVVNYGGNPAWNNC
ncbi:hypothetical protein O6H91_Y418400 [Diphasiastrum complanatum]|nr:hypothetical protein O6H91_Y418400 [Diphasiastrum complanatum]